MPETRLFVDRRRGTDRRVVPRRQVVTGNVPERRRMVDRRRGAERRSTLDRRGRAARHAVGESPGEHVRNALQLLVSLTGAEGLDTEERRDLAAALERLRRALGILERRRRPPGAP